MALFFGTATAVKTIPPSCLLQLTLVPGLSPSLWRSSAGIVIRPFVLMVLRCISFLQWLTPEPFCKPSKFVDKARKDQCPQQDFFTERIESVDPALQVAISLSRHIISSECSSGSDDQASAPVRPTCTPLQRFRRDCDGFQSPRLPRQLARVVSTLCKRMPKG